MRGVLASTKEGHLEPVSREGGWEIGDGGVWCEGAGEGQLVAAGRVPQLGR